MTGQKRLRATSNLPPGPLMRVGAAFTEIEIERIDAWGFDRRIRDRTTVLRTLIRDALEASNEMPTTGEGFADTAPAVGSNDTALQGGPITRG